MLFTFRRSYEYVYSTGETLSVSLEEALSTAGVLRHRNLEEALGAVSARLVSEVPVGRNAKYVTLRFLGFTVADVRKALRAAGAGKPDVALEVSVHVSDLIGKGV